MTIANLAPFYLWIKALHVTSMIAWIAGMFSLTLLFAYRGRIPPGSPGDAWLKVMERRLLRQIVNPAMIATWTFGILLALTPGIIDWAAEWWRVKLAAVILLSALHGELSRWRRSFDAGGNTRPRFAGFYRTVGGAIFLLVALAVAMVIVRPF